MNDGIRMWYLQVVVHVCHVRSIAKCLDERFLRFGYSPLLAKNTPQVAVSWNKNCSFYYFIQQNISRNVKH